MLLYFLLFWFFFASKTTEIKTKRIKVATNMEGQFTVIEEADNTGTRECGDIKKLVVEISNFLKYVDIIDNVDFLIKLHAKIYHYGHLVRLESGLSDYFPIPITYAAECVMKRIDSLTPVWYEKEIILFCEDVVNGHPLFDFANPLYSTYKRLCQLCDEKADLGYEEFNEQYEKVACREWGKMDANGDHYCNVFWRKGYENAWELTNSRNRELLWKLPFNKRFLLETVRLGCNNGMECVRYSNCYGVWLERKRALEK